MMVVNQDAPPPAVPGLPQLLLLLSFTTGLVDAISVLGLGKVFTANMTGNVVFLGFAAAGTPGFRIAPYLVALAAFLAGAVIAGRTGPVTAEGTTRAWLLRAAIIEAVLLTAAALAAAGFDIGSQAPSANLFAVIALTAAAMGFRNGAIRQLREADLTTTVLTLTLTALALDSRLAGRTNQNWARRLAGVAAIFTGAGVGAVLVIRCGLVAPLLLAAAIAVAGTATCTRRWARRSGAP